MAERTITTSETAECSTAEVAAAVLELMSTTGGGPWYISEISAATGHRLVEVAVAVARLTFAGQLGHDGIGSGYWLDQNAR